MPIWFSTWDDKSLGYCVYVLMDPRDDSVRYVGMTGDAPSRFYAHLQCDGSNVRKDAWIRELKAEGHELIMLVLEKFYYPCDARDRERYLIAHYKVFKAPLYNRDPYNPFRERKKFALSLANAALADEAWPE